MKESRIKELMESVGMPDSQSLFIALQQTANEVEQEVRAEELACHNECDSKETVKRVLCTMVDQCTFTEKGEGDVYTM